MDLETAEDFKSYLREEVVRGSSGSHKKMVGTKVSGTHTHYLPSTVVRMYRRSLINAVSSPGNILVPTFSCRLVKLKPVNQSCKV